MNRKIVIILGHPAHARKSFCEAVAHSYAEGAREGGHEIDIIKVADMTFDPILHEGDKGAQAAEPDIEAARRLMAAANHWVIIYPLWQFMIPALLKGFCERVLAKGFAYDVGEKGPIKLLTGKSARIIQTMGMPGFAYRWWFHQHSVKAFKNMLSLTGISPVRATYCGLAESPDGRGRIRFLAEVRKMGRGGY